MGQAPSATLSPLAHRPRAWLHSPDPTSPGRNTPRGCPAMPTSRRPPGARWPVDTRAQASPFVKGPNWNRASEDPARPAPSRPGGGRCPPPRRAEAARPAEGRRELNASLARSLSTPGGSAAAAVGVAARTVAATRGRRTSTLPAAPADAPAATSGSRRPGRPFTRVRRDGPAISCSAASSSSVSAGCPLRTRSSLAWNSMALS